MFNFRNRFFVALIAATVFVLQPTASAKDGTPSFAPALDDFMHYSLVANVEFAEAYAVTLLRSEMTDEEFYSWINKSKERQQRFDRAIGWALFVDDLEPLAAALEDRYEAGRTSVIRNAARLDESIALLDGTTRQRILAQDRLVEAGEYAVPKLLQKLQIANDASTSRKVKSMLIQIGRDAVLPLQTALPFLDNNSQILVANVLGEIGYTHAAPSLLALVNDSVEAPDVRDAARRALERIGIAPNTNLSTMQTVVAKQFYEGQPSVLPPAIGGHNVFWVWDSAAQLDVLDDVQEEIFDDVMAMYFASQAIASDSENTGAMSVFVAANLRRNREQQSKEDLVFGNLPYSPEFYATVFGPEIAQMVLSQALEDGDSSLALDAIAALSRTAGAGSLVGGTDSPLVAGMYYPDRNVQYESALTIAATLPNTSFEGSYRVVPLLASAVRNGGEMFALVVGDDENARREVSALLNENDWSVVGSGTTALESIETAGAVPGFDLVVVIARSADHGELVVEELASMPETTVTPVFVLANSSDTQILNNTLGDSSMVEIAKDGISDSAKLAVIEDLLGAASGGRLSFEEQTEFATRALAVLRDIALAETILEVDDSSGTLIAALNDSDFESKSIIAQTLSMINDSVAQRALVDAALTGGDLEEQVMLLDEAAASVRRWGNLAQEWQVELVVDLAENSNGSLADAAARLNGALDHPHTSVTLFLP
jgi:hypothetical protein